MSTLSELLTRLAALVPAQSGAPTTAQYERAIRDAVADFGYRCPRTLYGTLAIVAGTAAYALPAGFQRLIDIEAPVADTFRDTAGFLVAYDTATTGTTERHVISATTITFYPTPAYTATRGMWYAAGYPYDEASDTFTGLTAQGENAVLLRATAGALRLVAQTAAGSFSYRIGDVTVDKSKEADRAASAAAELDAAYLDACRSMTGFIGARAEYAGWEGLV